MKYWLFTFFCLPFFSVSAQTPQLNVDSVYVENLLTVQLVANANPLSFPAFELGKGGATLTFDDMDADNKDYVYTIEQCNRDWEKTKLDRLEYLDGYSEDRILNFQSARTTNVQYMHYKLSFPNENMRLTKSGNYVLKVYHDDRGDKKLVITRRFVVYEQIMVPSAMQTPANAFKFNTHQEFDVTLDPKTFRIQNAMQDVKLTILQNNRWDNALTNIAPAFIQGDKLVFDYQDVITFQAGKEWRFFDISTTRFRTQFVQRIDQNAETWEVTLRRDLDRAHEPYILLQDLNGGYYVENRDPNGSGDPDYIDVNFSLNKENEIDTADVYIWGALSDFKIQERFKMTYNELKRSYEAQVRLKQGYYSYAYVTVPDGKKTFYTTDLEGDWYEAQNDYQILVYFRPFGARHDRVIGFYRFTYNKR